MNLYIGIDIGTYETKGVLINGKGEILYEDHIGHQLIIPQAGWAEHDPDKTWWHDVEYLLTKIASFIEKESLDSNNLRGITFSSIAPSVVPVDSNGKALRNGILYGIDTRSTAQINYLNDLFGKENILDVGKQVLTTQAGGPKMLWIKQNEPDVYAKTKYFLTGAGYVAYKLTKKAGIDHYTAASMAPFYDFENHSWHTELVNQVISVNQLPPLGWSSNILGNITPEIAERYNFHPHTFVTFGTTDALAEAISCGSIDEGNLMLMYGSSTFFILNANRAVTTDKMWSNLNYRDGLYSITGGTSTAGTLTRWFIDLFSQKEFSSAELFKLFMEEAADSVPGANGVICLPHFSGERTPLNNPNAKGVFFGLTLANSRGDLYRAILEGIAFSIKQNIEYMKTLGLEINKIIAIGGGTKNKLWLQIVSDVCGIEQIVTKNKIGAAYGDAFLAALNVEQHLNDKSIKEWLTFEDPIKPNASLYEFYEKQYEKYKLIYQSIEKSM